MGAFSLEFCALAKPLGSVVEGLASTHNQLFPTPGRFMAFAIFDELDGTLSTYATSPHHPIVEIFQAARLPRNVRG
jgi:hypothetical protein